MKTQLRLFLETHRSRVLPFLAVTLSTLLVSTGAAQTNPLFGVTIYNLVRINPDDGMLQSAVGFHFSGLNDLTTDGSGVLFSATFDVQQPGFSQLVSVNPLTGQVVPQATLDFGAGGADVRGLAFSAGGVLFALNDSRVDLSTPDNLYTIDIQTGVATLVGNTGVAGIQALAFSPGGTLYGWDVTGLGLVQINPLTGVASDVNPAVGGLGEIQGLTFGPDGRLYGARDALYTIDTITGVATLVGSGGYSDIRGLAFAPVPEPTAVVLLAVGLVAGGISRRFAAKNKKAVQFPGRRDGAR